MTPEEVRAQVLSALDAQGIPYEQIEHECAHTMEECAACEARLGGVMPKNLFLTTKSRKHHCLLVVRADAVLHTSSVSRQAGTPRLSFAPEDALYDLMRTRPGSISPLGLMFDEARQVTLLMDESLREEPRLLFHPCDNRCTLAFSGRDFFELLSAWGREIHWITMEDGKDESSC